MIAYALAKLPAAVASVSLLVQPVTDREALLPSEAPSCGQRTYTSAWRKKGSARDCRKTQYDPV